MLRVVVVDGARGLWRGIGGGWSGVRLLGLLGGRSGLVLAHVAECGRVCMLYNAVGFLQETVDLVEVVVALEDWLLASFLQADAEVGCDVRHAESFGSLDDRWLSCINSVWSKRIDICNLAKSMSFLS